MRSRHFDEPFFNKAVILSCNASGALLRKAEDALGSSRQEHHVVLFESCSALSSSLMAAGYSTVDSMTVMELRRPSIRMNSQVVVRKANPRDLGRWCETYLVSFYGDLSLKSKLMRLARQFSKLDSVTLLLAELDGVIVGVTALYRTPRLLGLYCLGTLQQHRRKGVAHTLIGHAHALAEAEGRTLILQTLHSEGAIDFYVKAGFEPLYVKGLLSRKSVLGPPGKGRRGRLSLGTVIKREAGIGPHIFTGVFEGFHRVGAVRRIFGDTTASVLSELPVEVVDERGYMHIDAVRGSIVVCGSYLREGDERYLYLDVIHELVHIKQHMDGKELWDRSYKYVDRPTELEAYRVAVEEARRIGFAEEELVDYLKVEWVSEDDFRRFLATLEVNARGLGSD